MEPPAASTLFWHRRDIRTVDNVGLRRAGESGGIVPIYVVDPALLSLAGQERLSVFRTALRDLQSTYRELDTDLLLGRGDPTAEVPRIAAETDAGAVVWNQDHSKYARERDMAVLEQLEDVGLSATESPDQTLQEPGSILTTNGEHYSVFSYYHRKWTDRESGAPKTVPDPGRFVSFDAPDIGSVVDDWGQMDPPIESGRESARDRLEAFIDGPIYEYAELRDRPAAAGTSRLSQDLKFGTLGIREVYAATERAMEAAHSESDRESVEAFQRQLAWRDFYIQVLAANPETVQENFKDFPNPIEWREDEAALRAWKRGETGYPIVDAGMRQLRADGYMHNRVRMIVASFLTKDLQIDWRRGYHWFRERLIDHETANDVGGWQWAASTGTDAQPYFRIFNPTTQGERHDPDAEYIHRYVTELAGVDPEMIHTWPELSVARRREVAHEYPDPIVDHGERRESAIEMFERARGQD